MTMLGDDEKYMVEALKGSCKGIQRGGSSRGCRGCVWWCGGRQRA